MYVPINIYGGYDKALEKCKELVIKNIKESKLCENWDGEPCNVTAEEHFNNIVEWCRNINTNVWSSRHSAKCGFKGSYGAKHMCERDLKCYVANNWMKLAMILSGLDVNLRDEGIKQTVDYSEILNNRINFMCKRNKKDPYSIKYKYLCDFINTDLKYVG